MLKIYRIACKNIIRINSIKTNSYGDNRISRCIKNQLNLFGFLSG